MAESEVERFSGAKTAQNSKTEGGIEKIKHENVKLKEEDVPGTILPREKREECTVKQLQRWFLCRGAKTTGKKTQLDTSGLWYSIKCQTRGEAHNNLHVSSYIQGGCSTCPRKQSHKCARA